MITRAHLLLPLLSLCLAAPALGGPPPTAAKPQTKITWLGHAAFEIVTPKGRVLMIDPWLRNPSRPKPPRGAGAAKDPVTSVRKLDYILLTHGHFDHVGDAVELGKLTRAKLVTGFELGQNLARVAGYPKDQMGLDTLINIGGEITLGDGEITVAMVPAVHSSSVEPGEDKGPLVFGGVPGGFVLQIKDGPTIYHTGDTAFYRDMELIGETYAPDLALINIGGHFGMEPPMAARAAEAVRAKLVVPHHFKSFPILTQDSKGFFQLLDQKKIAHRELPCLGTLIFEGKTPQK